MNLRQDTAKHIRNIRKILQNGKSEPIPCSCSACELQLVDNSPATDKLFSAGTLGVCLILAGLIFLESCIHPHIVHAYTDEQYINAIYKAEGGSNATYLYGIRSVKCGSPYQAKVLCYQTVRNNRKRYQRYGYRIYPHFLEFLASRYCPTKSGNLSQSEKRLNQYWVKNVAYFLRKEV